MSHSYAVLSAAFANHLAFLARHRGSIEEDAGGAWIRGRAPEFTSWTPRADDSTIPPNCPAVRLAPWCGPEWAGRLTEAGLMPGEALTYMVLADPDRPIPHDGSTLVETVVDDAQAAEFARVQGLGFGAGDPAVDTWWNGFFHEQALKASRDPDQTLLLARRGDLAAGTTLTLRAAGVCGIYAVATLPALRRLGVSAALLEHVRRTCAGPAVEQLILQAMSGSYAEHYYARLGFLEVGRLNVWRRGRA